MKSQSRKAAVRAADKAFGDYIKKRDGQCVCCGTKNNLTCGHLFSRVAYSTRWNEQNAYCQCRGCNMAHEYNPGPLTIHYLSEHDPSDYEKLHALHRTPVKFQTYQIVELARYWTKRMEELG